MTVRVLIQYDSKTIIFKGKKEHVFKPTYSANQIVKRKTMDSARTHNNFLPSLLLCPGENEKQLPGCLLHACQQPFVPASVVVLESQL